MGVQLPSEPITRKEQYLAKAAGQAVEIPAEPLTREEAYLDEIAKNGSGGGGGTSNYNDLSNQPQIGGVTLSGNKSASDLGLADDDTVRGILDGQVINSFSGVETALSGKQNTLTAGEYIQFDGNEISVNREIPNETVSYEFRTKGTSEPNIAIIVTKRSNDSVVWEHEYQYLDVLTPIVIDDVIKFGYQWVYAGQWTYEMLVTSDSHAVGYRQSWGYLETRDYTEDFSLIDNTGLKLVIKSEMDAALADKQDKSDNALQTTDKTIVGGINELKSGLTNLTTNVNQLKVIEFDIASMATKKIKVNGTAMIYSDRGAVIIKGTSNRGVHVISNYAVTVNDIDTNSFTITSATGGSTSFIAMCRYGVEVTNVE